LSRKKRLKGAETRQFKSTPKSLDIVQVHCSSAACVEYLSTFLSSMGEIAKKDRLDKKTGDAALLTDLCNVAAIPHD